jgi:uncharacterized repeat protein (TIGR02543 family)
MEKRLSIHKKLIYSLVLLFILLGVYNIKASNNDLLVQISNRYGGTGDEALTSVITTKDGGYLAVGNSNSSEIAAGQSPLGVEDGWVLKLDKDLNVLSSKRFGGTNEDYLQTVVETDDGGFLAVGDSMSSEIPSDQAGLSQADGWVLKLDKDLNVVSSKRYGGSAGDALYGVTRTSDGFVAVGVSGSAEIAEGQTSLGSWDGWVLKIDNDLNVITSKRFGGTAGDSLQNVMLSSDGYYVAVGSSSSIIGGSTLSANNGWILKLDSNLNVEGSNVYGGSSIDELRDVVEASDGSYLAVGGSNSTDITEGQTPLAGYNGWILKVDKNLGEEISKRYGGTGRAGVIINIQKNPKGGYIAAGVTNSTEIPEGQNDIGDSDGWILELEDNLNVVPSKRYGGSDYDGLDSLVVTSKGEVVAVGYSLSPNIHEENTPLSNQDGWALKLNYKYEVKYNGNGHTKGKVPLTINDFSGTEITLPNKGTLEKEGYKFIGWGILNDTKASSLKIYQPGTKYTIAKDVTLYAQWEKVSTNSNNNGSNNIISEIPSTGNSLLLMTTIVGVVTLPLAGLYYKLRKKIN